MNAPLTHPDPVTLPVDADVAADQPALEAITRVAAALHGCPGALLLRLDRKRLRCLAHVGVLPACFAAGLEVETRGVPAHPFLIADALAPEAAGLAARARLLIAATDARFVLAVPVRADGRTLGVLCCFDQRPRAEGSPDLDPTRLADLALAAGALLAPHMPRATAALHDRSILERVIEAEGAMPMAVLDAGSQALPVTRVNRAFERLSGWRRDELIGRDLRALQGGDLMHQPGMAALGRAVARGRAGTVQVTSRRRDGTCFVNEVHVAPVHGPDGRLTHFICLMNDVTERHQAQLAERDIQAAELARRAKTEFLARVSHEMRTPLNAVIGFSQLLLAHPGTPDPRQVQDQVRHVLHAGERLLALINDVLDLQRVDEGRMPVDLRDLPLDTVTARVAGQLAASLGTQQLTLHDDIPPGTRVRADERLLRQVLLNVASNAVKYNRPGGSVRWSVEHLDGKRLALHVDDTGHGLSADQLARLFEPFERLGRETGTVEGSGLGLLVARRLCIAMGGTLTVTSRPGRGSRATITLTAPERPKPAEPLRMLYVEDNRINAILFQAAFGEQTGFDLRLAEDGEEALEQVDTWKPDVLVLDAHLPGIDGFELLQRLRARPGLDAVPAFMCSADAMPADIRRAADAGFTGYWPKPIDFAKIIDDLGRLGALSSRFQAGP